MNYFETYLNKIFNEDKGQMGIIEVEKLLKEAFNYGRTEMTFESWYKEKKIPSKLINIFSQYIK